MELQEQGVPIENGYVQLKQTPSTWFERFTKEMLAIHYKEKSRISRFFHQELDFKGITDLIIYADDIMMMRKKRKYKIMPVKEFKVKDLSRLKYFLGIEFAYLKQGTFIYQQKFINWS